VTAIVGAIVIVGAALTVRSAFSKAQPLKSVHVVVPLNSVDALVYLGGRDAGIFRKHGIKLTVDPRPFAGFLAGLPSRVSMVGTYPGLEAIQKINQGIPLAIIGGGLTVVNAVIVQRNSPFKSLTDLRGKPFGVQSTGSGAFKAVRTTALAAYGFDIIKDTKMEQVPAPALYKLLEEGRVDAMVSISSFTMEALSQPAKFRVLFSPNEYWIKQTGYPLVWDAPLVAWKSWVKQDPVRAKDFADAAAESFRALRNPHNFDVDVKKYGELAGITSPGQIATYKKQFAAKKVFLTRWNRKVADAEWKFLALAKKEGILTKVPREAQNALLLGNAS
jgi:ABC-type nitrate/sulfonate/bicarbonate transport system substrate-binding protein